MTLNDRLQDEAKRDIAKKDSRLGQVFIEHDSWHIIQRALEFEKHFDDTPILTPKWLKDNMINIHGGVCFCSCHHKSH